MLGRGDRREREVKIFLAWVRETKDAMLGIRKKVS